MSDVRAHANPDPINISALRELARDKDHPYDNGRRILRREKLLALLDAVEAAHAFVDAYRFPGVSPDFELELLDRSLARFSFDDPEHQ